MERWALQESCKRDPWRGEPFMKAARGSPRYNAVAWRSLGKALWRGFCRSAITNDNNVENSSMSTRSNERLEPNKLGLLSITSFSYENEEECLCFWVGASIWSGWKRRHFKTLSKVEKGHLKTHHFQWKHQIRSHSKMLQQQEQQEQQSTWRQRIKQRKFLTKGNKQERKQSNGETSVFFTRLSFKIQDHSKTKWYESGDIGKRNNGDVYSSNL